MRRVRRARREVDEERLLRGERLLVSDPGDRLVGHVRHEVVLRVVGQLDGRRAVEQVGRPLVRLAADEPVELVEALVRRPAVERARDPRLPGGRLVPLAEGRRAVAVEAQHLGDRGGRVRDLAGRARQGRRHLRDEAHVHGVVVAAGLEGGPRRRAERGRVEVVVAQAGLGEPVERGRRDRAAERARRPEAEVVDQHDDHVRRPGGGLDVERGRRLDVAGVELRVDGPLRLWDRQDRPVDRRPAGLRQREAGGQDQRRRGRPDLRQGAAVRLESHLVPPWPMSSLPAACSSRSSTKGEAPTRRAPRS